MTNFATYSSIADLVDGGLAKNPGIAASVKRGGMWHETSVSDFREQIDAFAFGLHTLGIRKGDRVALHAENCTEWLIIDQAILRLGAVTVPIYTTQPTEQIKYILANAEARIYIVSTQDLFEGQRQTLEELGSTITTVGILGSFAPGMETFHTVLDRGRTLRENDPELLGRLRLSVNPEDLATLIYTSGTTGTPKGVMLTHANITSNAVAVCERLPFDSETHRGDRMLSYLPLCHSLERIATIVYLYIGCTIYFVQDFQEIAEDFKTVRPLHMTTVPRLLEKVHAAIMKKAAAAGGVKGVLAKWALSLAENYDVTSKTRSLQWKLADKLVYGKLRNAVFGGNLCALTSGGAALSPTVMSFYNGIGIFCGQGYGLTETSPVISIYTKDDLRPNSIGTTIRDVEVRIAEDGEILTRGPHIMQGYYKMPERTSEVMAEDGWFHTGDIGHMDEDGHLYITDRKKQLFKLSTGKYIAPTPIETALCRSAYIEQAVVVGSERKFCAALIVLDPEAVRQGLGTDTSVDLDRQLHDAPAVNALIDEAVQAANEGLPHWEQVKKFSVLEQAFTIEGGELTPTMKLKRSVIRKRYGHTIDALYAE